MTLRCFVLTWERFHVEELWLWIDTFNVILMKGQGWLESTIGNQQKWNMWQSEFKVWKMSVLKSERRLKTSYFHSVIFGRPESQARTYETLCLLCLWGRGPPGVKRIDRWLRFWTRAEMLSALMYRSLLFYVALDGELCFKLVWMASWRERSSSPTSECDMFVWRTLTVTAMWSQQRFIQGHSFAAAAGEQMYLTHLLYFSQLSSSVSSFFSGLCSAFLARAVPCLFRADWLLWLLSTSLLTAGQLQRQSGHQRFWPRVASSSSSSPPLLLFQSSHACASPFHCLPAPDCSSFVVPSLMCKWLDDSAEGKHQLCFWGSGHTRNSSGFMAVRRSLRSELAEWASGEPSFFQLMLCPSSHFSFLSCKQILFNFDVFLFSFTSGQCWTGDESGRHVTETFRTQQVNSQHSKIIWSFPFSFFN